MPQEILFSLRRLEVSPSGDSAATGSKSAAFFPDVLIRRQTLGKSLDLVQHIPKNVKLWSECDGMIWPTPSDSFVNNDGKDKWPNSLP
jgi:hypothetical protein